MILGSKHVGAIFKCFNVKFYISAFVGVVIKEMYVNILPFKVEMKNLWNYAYV